MTKEPKIIKHNQELPREVAFEFFNMKSVQKRDDYMRFLRRAGWTLEAIGESSQLTRERVRQITSAPLSGQYLSVDFEIPNPPTYPVKEIKRSPAPSESVLRRLKELKPLAEQVRGKGRKFRAEAEEYVRLIAHCVNVENVTLYRLAKDLGVTHGGLAHRLVRYGYKSSPNGRSKCLQPVLLENRARY